MNAHTHTPKIKRRSPLNVLARTAAVAATAAALAIPTDAPASKGTPGELGNERLSKTEATYLEVRREFVDEFGVKDAGRNLVRWGQQDEDGVRPARSTELEQSVQYMRGQLNPPEVAAPGASVETAAAGAYDTAGAPTSVIECESGGDYGAVNPAGYYGAYQFDQGTWDAYAPEGYAGTNPAQAPPEVQDAAAAAVPYDAWPNC